MLARSLKVMKSKGISPDVSTLGRYDSKEDVKNDVPIL